MPSSTSPNAKQASAEGDARPALQPIPTNPSPLSQAVRHVHSVLLPALFYLSFNGLVLDPVSSMTKTLPAVTAIQAAYALVCVPVAGSQSTKATKKLRPGEKKTGAEGTGSNVVVAVFLSLLLSVFIAPFFHIIMVLFGAPVLTHNAHTFLCAVHLSILTLLPLFYAHGVDSSAWLSIAGFRAPFDASFGGLVGGVVGAWLGALPIPLDWDREWQKWPVTILCGIYVGYVVGKLIGGTLAFGKRF